MIEEFGVLKQRGPPCQEAFDILLEACAVVGDSKSAMATFEAMKQQGHLPSTHTAKWLGLALSGDNQVDKAVEVVRSLDHIDVSDVSKLLSSELNWMSKQQIGFVARIFMGEGVELKQGTDSDLVLAFQLLAAIDNSVQCEQMWDSYVERQGIAEEYSWDVCLQAARTFCMLKDFKRALQSFYFLLLDPSILDPPPDRQTHHFPRVANDMMQLCGEQSPACTVVTETLDEFLLRLNFTHLDPLIAMRAFNNRVEQGSYLSNTTQYNKMTKQERGEPWVSLIQQRLNDLAKERDIELQPMDPLTTSPTLRMRRMLHTFDSLALKPDLQFYKVVIRTMLLRAVVTHDSYSDRNKAKKAAKELLWIRENPRLRWRADILEYDVTKEMQRVVRDYFKLDDDVELDSDILLRGVNPKLDDNQRDCEEILFLLQQMEQLGEVVTLDLCNFVLLGFSKRRRVWFIFKVVNFFVDRGITPNELSALLLLRASDCLRTNGERVQHRALWEQFRAKHRIKHTDESCLELIRLYSLGGDVGQIMQVVNLMQSNQITLRDDHYKAAFRGVLKGNQFGGLVAGVRLFNIMRDQGKMCHASTVEKIFLGCVHLKNLGDSRTLFAKLKKIEGYELSVTIYATMIACLLHTRPLRWEQEASVVLADMKAVGFIEEAQLIKSGKIRQLVHHLPPFFNPKFESLAPDVSFVPEPAPGETWSDDEDWVH